VSHAQVAASEDFLLVGAYPLDQHWDLCRTIASEAELTRIKLLAFPLSDPVFAEGGPMIRLWKVSDSSGHTNDVPNR
jgi:uncharacterized protein YjlB